MLPPPSLILANGPRRIPPGISSTSYTTSGVATPSVV